MASIPKKAPTAGASATSGRKSPSNTNTGAGGGVTSPSPTGRRTAAGTAPSTPGNGVARTRSARTPNGTPVSARGAVKRPLASSDLKHSTSATDVHDEESRMESSALILELNEKLQQLELAEQEYLKQIEVLQSRFDEAIREQGKLEERVHEEEERVEGLENDKRETIRQRRELESIYEAERVASMKESEATQTREEEMQGTIQRLKELLAQRETRPGTEDGRMARTTSSPTLETGFAPPSALQRSNSRRNDSKLLLQKDQLIESLRLELAEVQIKLVEMENMGDASRRVQELERTVLEQRMTNARLMEDIDSYQLLLSERTLNGDFARNDLLRSSPAPGDRTPSRDAEKPTSLADELSSAASDDGEVTLDAARVKRFESEISSLKDSNKALSLYINKIIDRILQHQGGFENILSNVDDDVSPGAVRPAPSMPPPPPPLKDKELPPPPPQKDAPPGPSFLQRASSVVYGRGDKPRPRPQSTYFPPTSAAKEPGVTEDITRAPSIPLNRSHSKRMSMDMAARRRSMQVDNSAAMLVNNMYRGPSGEHAVQGPSSPSIVSPRNSFFAFRNPSGGTAPTVASIREDAGSDDISDEESTTAAANRKSALDALNGDSSANQNPRKSSTTRSPSKGRGNREDSISESVDAPSPPRSTMSREERGSNAGGAGGVISGNKMRPLRLVREAQEEEHSRKTANRSSWAIPQNITQGISGWWNKEGHNNAGGTTGGAEKP